MGRATRTSNAAIKPNHLELKETIGRVILCFDADVESSSMVICDTKEKKIMFSGVLPLRDLMSIIPKWVGEVSKSRKLLARIELPTTDTAYGAAKAMERAMRFQRKSYVQIEKAVFARVFDSGRVNQIALEIGKIFEGLSVPVEYVSSSERINVKENRLYKNIQDSELIRMFEGCFLKGIWRVFPTKLSISQVSCVYNTLELDNKSISNEEKRDALGLATPELLFSRFIKI